jgi:quercetin dioxygenase-like cupin family protein
LTLSRIFDVSLDLLFEKPLATDPCVIVRGAKAAEHRVNGLTYVPLSDASRFFNVQPMRVRVSPARRGKEHYRHEGEEWLYVLSGALTLSLAGKTYDLEQGDAAHFDSRLPHRLIARGTRDAEVLLVASRFTGAVPPVQSMFRQYRAIPAPGQPGSKQRFKLPQARRREQAAANFSVPTVKPSPTEPDPKHEIGP